MASAHVGCQRCRGCAARKFTCWVEDEELGQVRYVSDVEAGGGVAGKITSVLFGELRYPCYEILLLRFLTHKLISGIGM